MASGISTMPRHSPTLSLRSPTKRIITPISVSLGGSVRSRSGRTRSTGWLRATSILLPRSIVRQQLLPPDAPTRFDPVASSIRAFLSEVLLRANHDTRMRIGSRRLRHCAFKTNAGMSQILLESIPDDRRTITGETHDETRSARRSA